MHQLPLNFKLSAEQQTMLDNLKKLIEKQSAQAVKDKAAAEGAKALGGLLDPKK